MLDLLSMIYLDIDDLSVYFSAERLSPGVKIANFLNKDENFAKLEKMCEEDDRNIKLLCIGPNYGETLIMNYCFIIEIDDEVYALTKRAQMIGFDRLRALYD